jgi:hypothetical protein
MQAHGFWAKYMENGVEGRGQGRAGFGAGTLNTTS